MTRLLAGGALAVFLAALAAIVISSAVSDGGSESAVTPRATTTRAVTTRPRPTTPARAPTQPVKLLGVGAYDPEGDGHENDDLAPLAVDGDATTFWKTEHYRNAFPKTGVGLLLDMGRARSLTRVAVGTDASGTSARIELGAGPAGPFRTVSIDRPLTTRTLFALRRGATGRYLVVWVTSIPSSAGEAHITEVRATAKR
jgi:hypothetical protein